MFYNTIAESFDATRLTPWQGWQQLLPYIKNLPQNPAILDVGCGNGRFGRFVETELSHAIEYWGLDTNHFLLQRAHENVTTPRLFHADILEPLPLMPQQQFDLIVVFGVMHHVPAKANRIRLLQQLANRLTEHGLLVVTWWAFYENERFRRRIVAWDDDMLDEIEPHDYLLDWRRGNHALRYCHYVSPEEGDELLQAANLTSVEIYDADTNNRYVVLRHI